MAGTIEVASMHSVMTQSPVPLAQKRQFSGLDARAIEAAMSSVLAAKGSEQAAPRRYTKQGSSNGRRISAERGGTLTPGPKPASRQLFSPATADRSGYRLKHGISNISAGRV